MFKGGIALRQINIRDIRKLDVYLHYEQALQEAYDALTKVEDVITSLEKKLECQHFRSGGGVDKLKPLLMAVMQLEEPYE